jgi:AcrR family transcriptional regulator
VPKIVDHNAYRRELLSASFKVAASVGYGSLSMKQLAQSLNISTGTIYHYFKNKEDWFVSLVSYYSTEIFESLSRDIPRDASPSVAAPAGSH